MAAIVDYQCYGAIGKLFEEVLSVEERTSLEYLVEGAAGTGKSLGVEMLIDVLAQEFPGIRVLLARKTRASMTESVLKIFEEEVLGMGHPAITGNRSRETRQNYVYPNGSRVVIAGLDRPERIMSAQYDAIVVVEATEIQLGDWEYMKTRCRNGAMPAQIMIADCNPGSEFHWLNLRARDGDMTRLCSVHEDNPRWFDNETGEWTKDGRVYIKDTLGKLKGTNRARLRDGLWASEEGVVIPEYQPVRHLIAGTIELKNHYALLHVPAWEDQPNKPSTPVKLEWFFASQDWGDDSPGCHQVWGVDANRRRFRVAEVFKRHWTTDQWAEVALGFIDEFGVEAIVCDHEIDRIEIFNDRISKEKGRDFRRIARKAEKDVLTGIQELRTGFSEDTIYFLDSALREGRDEELAKAGKPYCTEQELPSYVWQKDADGRAMDKPNKRDCSDHGIDAARYGIMYSRVKAPRKPKRKQYAEGTKGHLLGHNEILGGKPRNS